MKTWTALLSQTGSEVLKVSQKLGRFPDRIIINKEPKTGQGIDDLGINHDLWETCHDRIRLVKSKPDVETYEEHILPKSLVTLNGWLRIIPPEICKKYVIYNGHPGLITKYPELKGKDPQKRAHAKKHKTGGCVIHRVTPGVDEGPVILDSETSIDNLSVDDIIVKLHELSINLWVQFLREHLL